jgi:hypothetical protein
MAKNQVQQPEILEEDEKRKRTRSPAYPFINLETAVRRAKQFYDREQQHAANLKVAVKHWDYEEKSSGGLQTAAALVAFGLMKDEGMGDRRKLQLTPAAVRIILNPNPAERESTLKEAALAPKIHRQMWQRWGGSLPSDESLRFTLLSEWEPKFNVNSVDSFIKQFRSTIAFAKLVESDKVTSEDGDREDSEGSGTNYVAKVGEYVQWESQGILQFEKPARVVRISTDGSFAFVEGTSTGFPIGELRKADAPSTPPPNPQIVRTPLLPTTNMQEDVYSIPEGRIVVQWPAVLSAESVKEVKEYLKLLEGKIARAEQKDATKEKTA